MAAGILKVPKVVRVGTGVRTHRVGIGARVGAVGMRIQFMNEPLEEKWDGRNLMNE